MAYPPRYDRAYDYAGFQAVNPSQPLPAGQVAADLDAASAAINAIRTFLMGALTADGFVPGAVPPAVVLTGFSQGLLGHPDEAAWRSGIGLGAFFQSLRNAADAAAFRALISAAADADVGLVQASAALSNQITNADLRVNQRAAGTLTGATGYAADGWGHVSAGGSRSVRRVTLSDADRTALGREDAIWAYEYACAGGAGGTDLEVVSLPMEGVRRLAGRRVAVAFWARRTAGAGNIASELVQVFGTGGSPSAQVTAIGAAKQTLTASWQRFVVYTDVPAATGKTLGTAGDDYLRLNFWLSAGSSFNARTGTLGVQSGTFQIADPVVRVVPTGASPTIPVFEPKPGYMELDACRRTYRTIGLGIQGWARAADQAAFNYPLSPPMRAAPTVAFLKSTWDIARNTGNSVFPAALTFASTTADPNGLRALFSHGGALTVDEHWASIESDVIGLTAELPL